MWKINETFVLEESIASICT